jgi:hypothetical protein
VLVQFNNFVIDVTTIIFMQESRSIDNNYAPDPTDPKDDFKYNERTRFYVSDAGELIVNIPYNEAILKLKKSQELMLKHCQKHEDLILG